MKKIIQNRFVALAFALGVFTIINSNPTARAQGTAFNFQGWLTPDGNGNHYIRFRLATDATSASYLGPTITNELTVAAHQFNATLDFGNVFDGSPRWLEISVAKNFKKGTWDVITPRTELTPVPYAIYAETAGTATNLAGCLSITNLMGSLSGDVIGPVDATVVSSVGGKTATNVACAVSTVDCATHRDIANTLVKRDWCGSFSANNISLDGQLKLPLPAIINSCYGTLFNSDGTNLFVGLNAGAGTTNGCRNTAFGTDALSNNICGSGNIAIGDKAGFCITGNNNIDIGNKGLACDNNVIRIGEWQCDTYIAGILHGNGAALCNLNASALTCGTVPLAQLPCVVLTNGESCVTLGNLTAACALTLPQGLINTCGGTLLDASGNNLFLGLNAGIGTTNGCNNTAIGFESLSNNVCGNKNTAIGSEALLNNTNGCDNIALGDKAGFCITGNNNIDIGNKGFVCDNNVVRIGDRQCDTYLAGMIHGDAATLGDLNVCGVLNLSAPATITSCGSTILYSDCDANFFTGPDAGYNTTNGCENTANGADSLYSNTCGYDNTANGAYSLEYNICGFENTANGAFALGDNVIGGENTASGFEALLNNLCGFKNTALGSEALSNNTNGCDNIAIGDKAGICISGSGNIDIGNWGQACDYNTIRIGNNQCQTFLAGVYNSSLCGLPVVATACGQLGVSTNLALGCVTADHISTSGSICAAGNLSASSICSSGNISASGNIKADGNVCSSNVNLTGALNLPDPANVYSGDYTLLHSDSGYQNFFAGLSAGNTVNDIGYANVALGFNAFASNMSGNQNIAIGAGSLQANTNGNYNTTIGASALLHNTSGNGNTANGYGALYYNANGNNNTANGNAALENNLTGSDNIALGYLAGYNITAGNNNIDIGNQGVFGESGIIRIGDTNSQTDTYLAGNVWASGNVTAYSVNVTSDRNAKEDFSTVNPQQVLAKVAAMPVTEWNYKTMKNVEHIGPMAQDFQAAFGLNGKDDKHISVVDEGGVALAAIQGLNQKLDEKDAEIEQLKQSVAELKSMVSQLAQDKTK